MLRVARALIFSLLLALASLGARPFLVVAWNVENLVDVDGTTQYEDYQGSKYSKAHCLTKLTNIAKVAAQFENGRGPDVILFCEIEVDFTPAPKPPDYDAILARYAGMKIDAMLGAKFTREIGDLPAEALLLKTFADHGLTGYHVAVPDIETPAGSNRKLQQKCVVFTRFPITATHAYATDNARAILEVQVNVDGAPLYLFANHWKSGAGDPETEPARVANAKTLRTRLDQILRTDPNADIILGGDFNSQYNQKQRYPKMKVTGLNDILGSQGNELAVRGPSRDLYNLWYELPAAERGSDTFRGEWGTLMHLIISRGLYDYRGVQYVDGSFAVAKFPGLNADAKGTPVRWTFDGPAGGGFSDHFPVVAKFTTVADNRTDRFLPLKNASIEHAAAAKDTKIDYSKIDLATVALTAESLPKDANLRTGDYKGKIFRVEGRVGKGKQLSVEFLGDTYAVWTFDEKLRAKLRAEFKAGQTLRCYGELANYKGKWEFIVQDPSWVE